MDCVCRSCNCNSFSHGSSWRSQLWSITHSFTPLMWHVMRSSRAMRLRRTICKLMWFVSLATENDGLIGLFVCLDKNRMWVRVRVGMDGDDGVKVKVAGDLERRDKKTMKVAEIGRFWEVQTEGRHRSPPKRHYLHLCLFGLYFPKNTESNKQNFKLGEKTNNSKGRS